jgi:mRNA interferase RelE/StbE
LQIVFSKGAIKSLKSLDKVIKKRIKIGIEGLTEIPPIGDIKMIQGYTPPIYRLRIGKYPVLYEYDNIDGEQVLLVHDIGSRGDIYK